MARKKLKALEAREDALLAWLSKNKTSHPDYESKIRELNITQTNIHIATYKPTTRETSGIKEAKVPIQYQ